MSDEDENQAQEESTNDEHLLDLGPALEPVEQRVIPYMGEEALAARLEGLGIYVTVKSICQMIGVRYDRQYDRIRRTRNLAKHSRLIKIQTKGGPQPMLCIKVTRLASWLDSIQTNSVKNERSRQIIESLQDDFAIVTNEVFMRRLGLDATALLPLPDDPIVRELAVQYNELLDIVQTMRADLTDLAATVSSMPGEFDQKLDQVVAMLQQFLALQQEQHTQIARIDERTKHLTPAHARAAQEYILDMVRQTKHLSVPLNHYKIYGRIRTKFRVPTYTEVDDERFDELMAFLRNELKKALGGDLPEQGNLF
jgi:hypothetical protein